ncbi:MAG: dihydrofolate reductase family protein [Ginsengibacter sp.]
MKRLVLFMHTSLDGYVAGPAGEMNWIQVDEELFEYAGNQTDRSDTALYGRVTWQMMENYWPTAAAKPGATKHDIQHSSWYNRVEKVVVSESMQESNLPNTKIISDNVPAEIAKLKQGPGQDIVIFGSPTLVHSILSSGLIDDYWLFVNPVLLGQGIPLFKNLQEKIQLKLVTSEKLSSGVVCLHYQML